MEQKAGEMQQYVGVFRKQWDEFVNQMDKLGNTLTTVQSHFEKLVTTRRKQLEKPMDRIKDLELGQDQMQKELEE